MVTRRCHPPLLSRREFLEVAQWVSVESDVGRRGKFYIAVMSPSLPPMVILRAWMFVPALQGQHQTAVWVSEWEEGCSNIQTYGDNCQKWQSAQLPPTGAAVPGARLWPSTKGLEAKPSTWRGWGWTLSLLDQWRKRTPWTEVQYRALRGWFTWSTEAAYSTDIINRSISCFRSAWNVCPIGWGRTLKSLEHQRGAKFQFKDP